MTAGAPSPVEYLSLARRTDAGQRYKAMTFDRVRPQPGWRVLDVGCGTGDDVRALGPRVGDGGRVVGVDCDVRMIVEAARRLTIAERRHLEFRVADAHALPFADNAFDACRTDRALQHMSAPTSVLTQMLRVTRPGGRIVASEPDWELVAIDAADRRTTRVVVQYLADRAVRHGWIGRQLRRLFADQRLQDVEIDVATIELTSFQMADMLWGLVRTAEACREQGLLRDEEAAEWISELRAADERNAFFGTQCGFIVSGTKPMTEGRQHAVERR